MANVVVGGGVVAKVVAGWKLVANSKTVVVVVVVVVEVFLGVVVDTCGGLGTAERLVDAFEPTVG